MADPSSKTALEYVLSDAPKKPIRALAFNPNPSNAHQLLVASWDRTVRLYHLPKGKEEEEATSGEELASKVRLVRTFKHEGAVMDVCWINDNLAASCSMDMRVRLLNLQTGQTNIIGKHNDTASRVRYSHAVNLLFSCSWDGCLKIWHPSATEPRLLKTLLLGGTFLAMDVSPPFPFPINDSHQAQEVDMTPRLVIALSSRQLYIYNLQRLSEEIQSLTDDNDDSVEQKSGHHELGVEHKFGPSGPWQPEFQRDVGLPFYAIEVRCMPSGKGYVASSFEGRIAVEYYDPSEEAQKEYYAFKCHRPVEGESRRIFPVYAIAFHPAHQTFASLGGDGVTAIWDPAAKKRTRQYVRPPIALSSGAMSSDGTLQACASGYQDILSEDKDDDDGTSNKYVPPESAAENIKIYIRTGAWDECRPKAKGGGTD